MWLFFLSNLNMGGGGTAPSALVSYVDPTQVTLIDTPALAGGVDPTAVTLIDTPSSDADIDPTQASLIQ